MAQCRHPACRSAGRDSLPWISCCSDASNSYLMLPEVPPCPKHQHSSRAPKGRDSACLCAETLWLDRSLPITQVWRGDPTWRRSGGNKILLTVLILAAGWRGRLWSRLPSSPSTVFSCLRSLFWSGITCPRLGCLQG